MLQTSESIKKKDVDMIELYCNGIFRSEDFASEETSLMQQFSSTHYGILSLRINLHVI